MDPKTLEEGRRLYKNRHKNMRFPGSFSAWTTWSAKHAEALLADAVSFSIVRSAILKRSPVPGRRPI